MTEPVFVDRVGEMERLVEVASRGGYLPLYIYGPEGCGKTRLLKEFIRRLRDGEWLAIYVDALEAGSVERAVEAYPRILGAVREAVETIAEASAPYPIGGFIARYIGRVVEEVGKRLGLGGRRVVVAVDDVVGAIGLNRVEHYVKWLYELTQRLREVYRVRSVAVVATTSEGLSLEKILRHSYASVALLWNLPREAFEELLRSLGAPGPREIEEVWRVTGGNPRRGIEIAVEHRWSTNSWLDHLSRQLRPLYEELRRSGLAKHLADVVEDPDTLSDKPVELYRKLLSHNLVIYKWIRTLSREEVPRDPELGIGRYYAWQIPGYKIAMGRLLEERL